MITIIACLARNRVIGHKGQIPWKFPANLKHFKEKTTGNTVVMGRKTFDSVGVLSQRRQIILTREVDRPEYYPEDNVFFINTPEVSEFYTQGDIYIAGGEQIYKLYLDRADRMMLTYIHMDVEGDAFFPTFNAGDWKTVEARRGNRHSYICLER